MTRVTFNAALIERSAIAKALIKVSQQTRILLYHRHTRTCTPHTHNVSILQAFRKCEEQSTRCVLLQTIQILSVAPTNCNHMLSVGGAEIICDSFTLPDPEQR